ncbi:MAG: hypothetical protein K0S33_2105 [Bacteroidetes bacterium]|jgi:hypothetical protein|nr:hypothetical protein [Bacteroidota bacterium]
MKYNFDHDTSWDYLLKMFNAHLPANEAWNKLIEFHEKKAPKTYWAKLKEIDLAAEQIVIKDWLQELVKRSPLPETVSALWVGMFKHMREEKEVYMIYLTGSDSYTKDDIEWASDPSYLPEDRYAIPATLNEIEGLIQKDKTDYHFLDWILPVAYCAFILDEIIRTSLDKKLFLTHKPELFFATGHDSGDYLDLSVLK